MDHSNRSVEQVALTVTRAPNALVLRLVGELDLCTVTTIGTALRKATDPLPPPSRVVLDLTAVSFLSAAGLRALYQMIDACAKRNVATVLVVDPASIVSRVLRLMPPEEHLTSFASLDQALHTTG
jgi:anti-anti-sigma factor